MCSQVRTETMSDCGKRSGVSWAQLFSCLKMLWHSRETRDVEPRAIFFSEWADIYICPLTGQCFLHSDQCEDLLK